MKNSIAIAAISAIASVAAESSFAVVNHCPFDIYIWSVAGGHRPSDVVILPANDSSIGYKEPFRFIDDYNGVSVKISPYYVGDYNIPGDGMPITQLEYTVPPRDGMVKDSIFYDLSFVDKNSLAGVPLTMQTSDPSGKCASGVCGADGMQPCDAGYLWSTDDTKTHACGLEADIIWTLCDGSAAPNLIYKTGQVTPSNFMLKREAEPEPEPMAVCIPLEGGVVGLCDDAPAPAAPGTTASPTPSPTPSPSPAAVKAPLIALAKDPKSSSSSTPPPPPPPATSTAAPAPVATVPVVAPSLPQGLVPVSLLALKNLAKTGVQTWKQPDYMPGTIISGLGAREAQPEKREARSHNHMKFHQRRNRIVKRN